MNQREDALREALLKNIEETQRWQNYLKDNETAIENLSMFGKRLTVDVMVPVGKKAYMPGYLLHTNEVLVGHYQGYFSQCTSFKAKEICEHRIKMAKEHLRKLEMESELWQNKLEKPYAEGVMPSGEEREIIEDYNEENEKLWQEKHKISLREAKQKEREEREKYLQQQRAKINKNEIVNEKSEQEIFKMLEDAELMEELEQELDELEVDEVNDETIRKLMSGEMKIPEEKKRLAHDIKPEIDEGSRRPEGIQLPNIIKKNVMWKSTVPATNNNVHPNPELLSQLLNASDANENTEDEPLPEEVKIIKEQAQFLNAEDQIGFYEYQIEIIRQKIQNLPLRKQEELDEKIRLLNVLEHLEEELEAAEEIVGAEELNEKDNEMEENDTEEIPSKDAIEEHKSSLAKTNDKPKSNQKRRISFALEDQTLEFRKNETVTQMIIPTKTEKTPTSPPPPPPQRDIIKLYDEEKISTPTTPPSSPSIDKKDLIKEKVEKSLQYVSENQSKQNFDLVQQILETSMGLINTLHIKFQHSKQDSSGPQLRNNKESPDIPASPADLYDLHMNSQESLKEPSTLFINSYEGEDQVKSPVLKEVDRKEAFKDPKSEFSNPSLQAKSILKNKSSVDKENHLSDPQVANNNKSKKPKKKNLANDDDDGLSAYNKVMNDVVEKPPLIEPEPLPDVKFIDAHTPKKRISRFKQMRQGTEKI